MVQDDKITYDDIKKKGIYARRIHVQTTNQRSKVILELENETKETIGENLNAVLLFGVHFDEGPYFVAVIEEGILNIMEEMLYKITYDEKHKTTNMRIYIAIW